MEYLKYKGRNNDFSKPKVNAVNWSMLISICLYICFEKEYVSIFKST